MLTRVDRLPWEEVEEDFATDPLIARVTCDPAFRGGKPYIKEVGLTVRHILNLLDTDAGFDKIIEQYPRLTKDDIKAALRYAAWKLEPWKREEY